jgi:hypothetical protein
MTRKKYRLPPPPRSDAPPAPAEIIEVAGQRPLPTGPLPVPLSVNPTHQTASSEADGVNIIEVPRLPKRWLRVALALAPGTDPAQAALAAARFVTRMRAADRRLRLTLEQEKCGATAGELVLVFAPLRWGSLEIGWLEEVKPVVRDIAAEFAGTELRAVEVISE